MSNPMSNSTSGGTSPAPSPSEGAQRVALPAYLPQRLSAFRIGRHERQSYVARDNLMNKTYDFEPWQFFVLEVLPGCEDFEKLRGIFRDRYGQDLPRAQFDDLLSQLADAGLLNEQAVTHPLLSSYAKRTYTVEGEHASFKSFRKPDEAAAPGSAAKTDGVNLPTDDEILPAGIQDAIDFDPRAARRMWVLFDPQALLKRLTPALSWLKYTVYPMPLLVLTALGLAINYSAQLEQDSARLLGEVSFFEHLLASMFSINLIASLATAMVAFHYRASVKAFGLALLLGFVPRFTTRITHTEQLSRHERMWLHATPMLVRLCGLSVGILIWYIARDGHDSLAKVGIAVAMMCALGLALTANPLIKSSGYQWLSAFTNEPHLRGKAYRALLSRLRGKSFREADDLLLATYAAATGLFSLALVIVAAILIGTALHELQLGGSAIIVAAVLCFWLGRRTLRYFKEIEASYERTVQYERWRKRVLPAAETGDSSAQKRRSGVSAYLWRALPLCLFAVLFLPYSYNPGGNFVIYPNRKQIITTDVAGAIQEVYYDGGETLKKGTVIAKLADDDNRAQVEVYTAKMAEQQSIVADLKSRPRPQDVALAQSALEVQRIHTEFTKGRVERTQALYDQGAVSFDELDAARREYEMDVGQVAQKEAALAVAKLGATPDEIAAAQSKWESLKQERDSYQDKVKRAVLTMPFDGNLLTLHLQQKTNAYLNRGEAFAVAENTAQVTAEIEVPESDTGFVRVGEPVRIKPLSYSDRVFTGTITTIDHNITEQRFGNVVRVIALVDNPDGLLKTDMSGYAKVDGPTMPVWKAFSLAVLRFVNIQIWSWIP